MTVLDQFEILEEVVVTLRNSDILSTAERGVTTTTEDFSGDGNQTDFIVSEATIKNVRSVLIGAASQTYGTDYSVDYSTKTISFTSAPGAGADNVHIQYDYGADRIHPSYPKQSLSLSSFPRIHVEFINITSTDGGFGNCNRNTYNLSVVVYDTKKKSIRNKIKAIRTVLINNITEFYYLKTVKPILIGPLLPSNGFDKFKDKIFQQNIDFTSRFNIEVN